MEYGHPKTVGLGRRISNTGQRGIDEEEVLDDFKWAGAINPKVANKYIPFKTITVNDTSQYEMDLRWGRFARISVSEEKGKIEYLRRFPLIPIEFSKSREYIGYGQKSLIFKERFFPSLIPPVGRRFKVYGVAEIRSGGMTINPGTYQPSPSVPV